MSEACQILIRFNANRRKRLAVKLKSMKYLDLPHDYIKNCMKNIILFCLLYLISSCTSGTIKHEVFMDTEIISVENAIKDDMSFLDSIEIIPLESKDHTLMKEFSSFQYLKEQKMYMIMDSRQYIFLFDENGDYISSSNACRGEGPHDYLMAVDAVYNRYSNLIEIYSPVGQGIIHRYDLSFNWIENSRLSNSDNFAAMKMDLLDENIYAFEPVRNEEENLTIRLCDFSTDKTSHSKDVSLIEEGYVSTLTMMQKAFSQCDAALYYAPYYMDYHFYEYNLVQRNFKPIYELDLGDKVTKKELDEKLKDQIGSKEFFWKKCEYLLASEYLLPIIRMIDDSFVYACCIRNKKTYHLIYNRKTKKTYFLSPEAPVNMHRCYALQDNVLATILFPYELEKYVNEESRMYMSEKTLRRLEEVKDEDNPVVIKYYLMK